MIDLTPKVYSLLSNDAKLLTLLGNDHIYYISPQIIPTESDYPLVIFYETENLMEEADGREWGATIVFSIEIWSTKPPQNIAARIDDLMVANCWERTGSVDGFDAENNPILYHKAMKYEIYQESDDI